MKIRYWLVLLIAFITSTVFAKASFDISRTTLTGKADGTFNQGPTIVLNSTTGNSLIVWERAIGTNHSIFGKLLNPNGKRLSAVFPIATGSHPAVAYNEKENEFLLAYDDNPTLALQHSDIYTLRLNQKGKPIGSSEKITTDDVSKNMTNLLALVAYNAAISKYGIFWNREITASNTKVGDNGAVALLLDKSGKPSGSISLMRATVIEQSGSNFNLLLPLPLDVKVQPLKNKFAVGFFQQISGTNGAEANYYLGTIKSDLSDAVSFPFSVVNTSHVVISSTFVRGLRIAFLSNGRGLLVFVDSTILRLRKIGPTGKPSGTPTSAFKKPKSKTKFLFPDLVLTQGSHGVRALLIAIQDASSEAGEASLWAQLLDGSGLKVNAPSKLEETKSAESAQGLAISVLPHPNDSETYPFLNCYTLVGFKSPGQTFTGSGLVLLKIKVTFQ